MFAGFIVYYFILDVTICHIITVKSLLLEEGVGQVWHNYWGVTWCDTLWQEGSDGGKQCWKKRDIINEWPLIIIMRPIIYWLTAHGMHIHEDLSDYNGGIEHNEDANDGV